MADHKGLPVAGYRPQSDAAVGLVNLCKELEELVLRRLDVVRDNGLAGIDQRWLAIGRQHIEIAFMAINRSIFQPTRISLPGDPE